MSELTTIPYSYKFLKYSSYNYVFQLTTVFKWLKMYFK